MSLKEKIYNELKTCPSLQAMIDTLQDATTPGGSLTPGWLTKKFGRGEPMTFEQADNGKTNPYYQKGVDNGYNINCSVSVFAFEARLRGYDVIARANDNTEVDTFCDGSILREEILKNVITTLFNDYCTTSLKTIKFLESNTIMGARYFLSVLWSKKQGGGGHALLMYKDKLGNLIIYCPQTNTMYDTRAKQKALFDLVRTYTFPNKRSVLLAFFGRIDNLPFNRKYGENIFIKAEGTK